MANTRKNTAAIAARLENGERVHYEYGNPHRPKAFVVVANGDVCPIDDLRSIDHLHPITIVDNQLYCDLTVSSTNTELDIQGYNDFKEAVRRYNNAISEKLHNGFTDDDDSSKIIDSHLFK